MKVRIIILNYNGSELLPKCLPSIVEASKGSSNEVTIAVLDNLSTDESISLLAEKFPAVEVAQSSENAFLCSYNDYLKIIEEDVVILLNNDIRVQEGFIDPLLKPFEAHSGTFMVAPCVMDYDGQQVEAGRAKARMRFGLYECDARFSGFEEEVQKPSETDSSGFGAFSREKFLELGGYDRRYLPGILEDVDLCFRAKQRGFKLYYEPRSVVYHMGQASFKKAFGEFRIAVMAHRNTFLFMWKNLRGFRFWAAHLFFLPFRILFACLKGNFALGAGFLKALVWSHS